MTERLVLGDAVRTAGTVLEQAGVPSAQHDARVLAEHVLGRALVLAPRELTGHAAAAFAAAYRALIARRAAREPLQHLTGAMYFRHLELTAGPGVFVVRPETEVLVDHALALLSAAHAAAPTRVVDLCTGSGAIALAIATERPGTEVWAVELSEIAAPRAAAHVAAYAEQLAAVGSRVTVVAGDATATGPERVLPELDGSIDLVVSNPPYIPPEAVPVDPEVRDHDPALALYGRGADGLEIPAGVLRRARMLLRPGAPVLMEHADVQGPAARALAADLGFTEPRTLSDLTGRDRFLHARAPLSSAR